MKGDRARLLRSLSIDRESPPVPDRSKGRRWLGLSLALLLLLAAAGGAWVFYDQPSPPADSDRPVLEAQKETAADPGPVQPPAAVPRPAQLIASGYVVARRKATIAAEITGKIEDVLVDEGMMVEAGQVVARLDSVLAQKDLDLARSRAADSEAGVAVIQADLSDAELVLRRQTALSARNFASEAELSRAGARVAMLKAQLQQARQQVETARLEAARAAAVLDQYQVRAPFAGIVVERSAQPGEMISPVSAGGGFTRTGVCTVVDMDSLEVEVDVNEAYIGRVRQDQPVDIVLDAYPGVIFGARVIAIVPTANREKATIKVRIALDGKDPRVLPDMAVKATFKEVDKEVDNDANKDAEGADPAGAGNRTMQGSQG